MNAAQQILAHTDSLFDVVGVSQLPGGDSLLILGLESTPERDLDEFERLDGDFHLYGYKKHVWPKVESIINFICGKGFSAEAVGKYGYPLKGEVNLKEEAIRTGLGNRGKSTVVLNLKYGPRLRFAAIKTTVPLEPLANSALTEEENPVCSRCSICIDACPVSALDPYHMPDTSICLSNTAKMTKELGRLVPCAVCLNLCPATEER